MKVIVERLNVRGNEDGSFSNLPYLNSLEEITDINEVYRIQYYFTSREEADEFVNSVQVPKSMKPHIGPVGGSEYTCSVRWEFNTFFTNKSTGGVNETAVKKRNRVIKELKNI